MNLYKVKINVYNLSKINNFNSFIHTIQQLTKNTQLNSLNLKVLLEIPHQHPIVPRHLTLIQLLKLINRLPILIAHNLILEQEMPSGKNLLRTIQLDSQVTRALSQWPFELLLFMLHRHDLTQLDDILFFGLFVLDTLRRVDAESLADPELASDDLGSEDQWGLFVDEHDLLQDDWEVGAFAVFDSILLDAPLNMFFVVAQ